MVNSPLEPSKDRVYTTGQMAASLMGNGKIIKLMAMDNLSGLTAKNILVSSLTIFAMGREFSFGLMVENMRDNGLMVSNMETVYILYKMENQERDIGKTEKELNGQIDPNMTKIFIL